MSDRITVSEIEEVCAAAGLEFLTLNETVFVMHPTNGITALNDHIIKQHFGRLDKVVEGLAEYGRVWTGMLEEVNQATGEHDDDTD
ncbi:hypothetical protein G4Y79_15170 [Phototrophicus methaneseepsis]|uniref:Uncharacterized protein n=1 Tax=Phototrophicus methaneseepsis TaxID=2710758 RepID=A0A7S8IDQ0_9CHLR|nr:hypothetical protein [Phototrophicus methaneseepsis]QPC81043.1 hypothetical protein G4Y79_15170 [Phototrophicus methaneseepsis]